jgi:cysteine synthase
MPAYPTYEELIGKTQVVDITRMLPPAVAAKGVKLLGKCEFLNPGFSMKDRIARQIFDQAESSGALKPGGTVVAASSGNTGAAVAMIGAMRGYEVVILTNDKCSQEKQDSIKAYGAELIVVGKDKDYMEEANVLSAKNGWFDVNQYDNHANSLAHELTLGPEIWEQTGGAITHFVAGGSTGGTVTGVGRALKKLKPEVQIILADPIGSVFEPFFRTNDLVKQGKFLVEGVGKGNIPGVMDFSVVDDCVLVSDDESFSTCHALAQQEGLLIGGSGGMNVCAAMKVPLSTPLTPVTSAVQMACRSDTGGCVTSKVAAKCTGPAVIMTILCDNGVKYLSKVYSNEWLTANAMSPVEDTSVLAKL